MRDENSPERRSIFRLPGLYMWEKISGEAHTVYSMTPRPRATMVMKSCTLVTMVVAALAARGETRISAVEHIQRGYTDILGDLRRLGAAAREE